MKGVQLPLKYIILILFSLEVNSDVTSQTLKPTSNSTFTTIENAEAPNSTKPKEGTFLKFQFNTVNEPLVQFGASGEDRNTVVQQTSTIDTILFHPIKPEYGLGIDTSFNQVILGDGSKVHGLGDTRVFGKYSLTGKGSLINIAVMPEFYLPSGAKNSYLSNGSFGGGGRLIVTKHTGLMSFSGNLGYFNFPESTYKNLDYRNQIFFGGGANLPLGKGISINIEASTTKLENTEIGEGFGDIYFGTQYKTTYNSQIHLGAGISNIEEDGSSSTRLLIGYNLLPFLEEKKTVVEKIKIVETIKECGIKTYSNVFYARPLSKAEQRVFNELPYISTKEIDIPTFQVGNKFKEIEANSTKNTQVLFAVDITKLPAPISVTEISDFSIDLNYETYNSVNAQNSNMICLLRERVCSGETFRDKKLQSNINQRFFKGKETPNDHFSRMVNQSLTIKSSKSNETTANTRLTVDQLIENSLVDTRDVLFDHNYPLKKSIKKHTLYFSTSNFKFVSKKSKISLSIKADSCTSDLEEQTGKESKI